MSKDLDSRYSQEIYREKYKKNTKETNKYGRKLLDIATKTVIDAAKTSSKKVVHKTAEATEELIGNKIVEKLVKPKHVPYVNSRDVEEIVVPPQKR